MALVAGRGVQATTRRTVRRCHIHAKVGLGPHVDNPHSTRGAAVCVRCGSYHPRRGSCDGKRTQWAHSSIKSKCLRAGVPEIYGDLFHFFAESF